MGSQGRSPGDTVIVLLTRDLRVYDQPALAAACRNGNQVIPLFVHDPALLNRSTASPHRLSFLVASLDDLRRSLRQRGGQLFVRHGDPTAEAMKVAAETGAAAIFVSDDVSRYARRRHHHLSRVCAQERVRLVTFPGATVVSPGRLVPAGGDHYRVFTPYWKRWWSEPWRSPVGPPGRVRGPGGLAAGSVGPPGVREGQTSSPLSPPGGESEARARVRRWLRFGLAGYEQGHDNLAADSTSRLSPYLHFGCLSANELAHEAFGRPVPNRSYASCAGATFTTRSWPHSRTWRRPTTILAGGNGVMIPTACKPGNPGLPASPSWMRACASCTPKAGCTTEPDC